MARPTTTGSTPDLSKPTQAAVPSSTQLRPARSGRRRGNRRVGAALLVVGLVGGRRQRRDHRGKAQHEGEQQQHAPDLHNLNLAYRFMDTRPIKFFACTYR